LRLFTRQTAPRHAPKLEVLIGELGTVDGLATTAITAGEVATLAHEAGDDPVEGAALVVEGLARATHTLLTSAESTEVLAGLGGNVRVELEDDAASSVTADGDVEEDAGVGHVD